MELTLKSYFPFINKSILLGPSFIIPIAITNSFIVIIVIITIVVVVGTTTSTITTTTISGAIVIDNIILIPILCNYSSINIMVA